AGDDRRLAVESGRSLGHDLDLLEPYRRGRRIRRTPAGSERQGRRASGMLLSPQREGPSAAFDRRPLAGDTAFAVSETPSPVARPVPTVYDCPLPLANVRVVDFSWIVAGPQATRILADLGADVIRVEYPGRLDSVRMGGPVRGAPPGSVDHSGMFN